nr:MAG TPA: hypothetical protein [Caudoviricetes sp.]
MISKELIFILENNVKMKFGILCAMRKVALSKMRPSKN